MKKLKLLDILLGPLTFVVVWYLKFITSYNLRLLPVTEGIFMRLGILPIRDHFYQPLINPRKHLSKPLSTDRILPGIDWNVDIQLTFLKGFSFVDELASIPLTKSDIGENKFYYNNERFCSGDSEYYYSLIRSIKPKHIVEIGSGMSTLLALLAIEANTAENKANNCRLTCIEPYRNDWLSTMDLDFIKDKVEDVPLDFFSVLGANDILFIDSSHIIRPQGDVLFEYLSILGNLKSGVIIHVHDIFSPKDYPEQWIVVEHKMWNEQYLLEAFLSFNTEFEVIGALNFLYHHHQKELFEKCPVLSMQPGRQPGSFWFRRK